MRLKVTALAAACVTLLAGKAEAKSKRVFPSWWLRAALCVHSYEGGWQANTGNGFYGGMQFLHSTWVSNGGRRYAEFPHQATPHQQLRVAFRLWQRAGWYPWPNTARMCGLL
jgi:Transglycosylase-like domain